MSSIKQCINLHLHSKYNKIIKTIYINSSALPHFAAKVLPNIQEKIILVTGDCDETIPNDLHKFLDFNKFINDDRIIKWFCQNWIGDHEKVEIMPIGLDYHTLANHNNHSWGPKTLPIQQEMIIKNIKNKSTPFTERIIKCYSNFHFFTTTRYGDDRKCAIKQIPDELVYYEPEKIQRINTWDNQSKYAFVVSPHGNGYDCHRTWEALALGCIPIMKKSNISNLFDKLPVLIINDWSDITKELLDETIVKFKDEQFHFEKLKLSYWIERIEEYRRIPKNDCVIGICIKNNAKYLPKVFEHLIALKKCFDKYKIIFVYDNNSTNTDDSIDMILEFMSSQSEIDAEMIYNDNEFDYNCVTFERRVVHITNARNTILRLIREKYASYKYFIMMDANYSCTENIQDINTELISQYLERDGEWDALSFNRKIYYDKWALSLKPFITSFWHYVRDNTNGKSQKDKITTANKSINDNFIKCISDKPEGALLEVDSAFCGFAIYKTNIFIHSKYNYRMDLSLFNSRDLAINMNLFPFSKDIIILPDCEHRFFHLYAKKNLSARIMIANSDIFIYQ
tara:strand:+ start:336 stop:2036 length:1701 start_codon:yes stop_codon:yes gene_type:complete